MHHKNATSNPNLLNCGCKKKTLFSGPPYCKCLNLCNVFDRAATSATFFSILSPMLDLKSPWCSWPRPFSECAIHKTSKQSISLWPWFSSHKRKTHRVASVLSSLAIPQLTCASCPSCPSCPSWPCHASHCPFCLSSTSW